jgi:uncharacterized delta-60 repeat protein
MDKLLKRTPRIMWSGLSFSLLVFMAIGCGGGGGGGDGGSSSNTGNFSLAGKFNGPVYAIAVAENADDIYVGGNFTEYNGTPVNSFVRLNSDGAIDPGFDVGSGFNQDVTTIALANDGSGDIYVGGHFTVYRGNASNYIARINSDGSYDAGFDVGSGFNVHDVATTIAVVRSIVVANDGSGDIYAGGSFMVYRGNASNFIARINSDGSYDAGFDVGSGFNDVVWSIAMANDGSGDIYAGGAFTVYRGNASNFIARINSDGSNDTGFDVGSGFNNNVFSVAVANDGSGDIYAGGAFTVYRGNARNYIARINSDSSNDAGFDVGLGFNDWVFSIAVTNDGSGDIYVGGDLVSRSIARINSDGSNDAGFDVGSGFNDVVYGITVANDGSGDIYAGGEFDLYDGAEVGHIARLDLSGQLN